MCERSIPECFIVEVTKSPGPTYTPNILSVKLQSLTNFVETVKKISA